MPNLGLNLPSLFMRYSHSVDWSVGKESDGADPWMKDVSEPQWSYLTTLMGTHKERTLANPQKFNLFGFQGRVIYTRQVKHSWRLGLDLMFDKTYAYVKDIETNLDTIPLLSQPELGIAIGKSWNMGRLTLLGEVGTYIVRPGIYKKKVYERVGFEYHLSEHFGMHVCLKFHRAVADYFEWGISYHWK